MERYAGGVLPWYDYVHSTLNIARVRRGAARDRVIDLLADQDCAVTAAEIEEALAATGRPTARASIYRVLDLLVDHGLVERVATGGSQARFERVLPSGDHHHHLVCDQCGRLVAFHDSGLERAIDRLTDRLGVRVESHEVLLRGACDQCE